MSPQPRSVGARASASTRLSSKPPAVLPAGTMGEQRRVCLAWTAMHMPTGAYNRQRGTMVSAQGWQLMDAPRFRTLGHF